MKHQGEPMKRNWPCFLLLFALTSVAAAASEPVAKSPIVATLSLPYDTILPGIPFDLVVTLKNVSDKPATAGLLVRIVVTDAGGRTLVAPDRRPIMTDVNNNSASLRPALYGYVSLSPGQSVEKVVQWDHSMPNWSHDSAFSGPGIYDIALELEYGDAEYDDVVNYVGILRTSTARLHRVAVGDDAVIWKRLQEISGGKWADDWFKATKEGLAFGEEVLAHHQESNYYPYALFLRTFNRNYLEEHIAPFLEAAKRFPDSPAFPYLLKGAADAAYVEASTAEYRKETEKAAKLFALAETYYREALKTNSASIREETEDRIRQLPKHRPGARNE
jgi:hypothetical protein